jgi:hypothetical protein
MFLMSKWEKANTGRLKVSAKKFTQHSVMKESGGFAAARKAKICCTGNYCVQSIQ